MVVGSNEREREREEGKGRRGPKEEERQLLNAGLDQVPVEGDVHINIITVNGILPLPLVEPHPDLIIFLKL